MIRYLPPLMGMFWFVAREHNCNSTEITQENQSAFSNFILI